MRKQQKMIEQKISIKNLDGETLVGLEDRPDTGRMQYPAVVLVHGFYGDKDEEMFIRFAKGLTTHGFMVYRFDLSGCGESEGDYAKTTITKLAEDVLSILDFVRSESQVDKMRIGMVGFSLGTTTILALRPKDVRCLVFIGALARPYEVLQLLFGEGFHPSAISSRVTSGGERVHVEPQFWSDFQRYDMTKQMNKLKVPVLFLHGELDDKVPLRESKLLFAAAAEPKEFVVVPGDKHELENSMVEEKLVSWCEQYLK